MGSGVNGVVSLLEPGTVATLGEGTWGWVGVWGTACVGAAGGGEEAVEFGDEGMDELLRGNDAAREHVAGAARILKRL